MSTFSAFRSVTSVELSVKSTLSGLGGGGGVRPLSTIATTNTTSTTSLFHQTRSHSHSKSQPHSPQFQFQFQFQSQLYPTNKLQCRHLHQSIPTSAAWVKNAQPIKPTERINPKERKERERKLKEIGLRGRAIPYKKVQVVIHADGNGNGRGIGGRGGLSPYTDLQQVLQQVETMNWNASNEQLQTQTSSHIPTFTTPSKSKPIFSSFLSSATAINPDAENDEEQGGGGGEKIKKPKPRYHVELIDNTVGPIVKIVDSKATYIKQKKAQENAKTNASNNVQKEIQMSWFSSEADVENKLIRVRDELEKGNKVALVIMPKKYTITPSPRDRYTRLDEISDRFADVAKEWKSRDMSRGNGIIYFQSTVPQQNSTKTETMVTTVDAKDGLGDLPKNVRERLARREKQEERVKMKRQRDALLYGEQPSQ